MNKHFFREFKYYIMVMLASFYSLFSVAQSSSFDTVTWKFSNPKQFGFTVLDVDYFDNNNAIAVGSDGGIAVTRDAGKNWMYGVFTFTNPATGFITKGSFNDIHFITSNIAYAVGTTGCMIKTIDAGKTWNLINTPLTPSTKNINTVWFTSPTTGYIGGQWNTADSIPKVYFTNNGGASWDSLASPIGGKTRVGYINNVNVPASIWDVTGKGKEIWRIEFSSPTVGYIIGSGQSHFPAYPAVNATTCLPTGLNTSTSANNAALVWKYSNGTLTDFSLSKERLGYSGIVTNTVACNTQYNAAQITPVPQTYRAINIINDSLIVIMSFNNNIVVRVYTGVNDNTINMATGLSERGRYQITNYPFPPTQGPQAGPPIPPVQVLLASNPYQIRKNSSGTLMANGNFARMFTSVDTGRNWIQSRSLPPGNNFSNNGVWALDIAPNGRLLSMGALGVVADSLPGSAGWSSNYVTVPLSAAFTKMEFADCNNGMAVGSGNINITPDGGKTWWDRTRLDFISSFYSINGATYRNNNPSQAFFAVSNGTIYYSSDINVAPPATPTLDPVYSDGLMQMNDVATIGRDSVWAIGYSSFSVAAASRTSKIYRSFNGGATWSVYSGFSVGTLSQNLTEIEFPSRNIGYAAGNRDTIYKTIDAGVTWVKLPLPTPGVTPQITYKDMYALNDNTVFLVGNGFPRKVVYRTTDGGATWVNITGNINALGVGNLNGVIFHDANNGYVVTPGLMVKTTNGGVTWTLEAPPTNCLFEVAAFAPKNVPPGISMLNRKLFVSGANISGAPIMEYGNPANINVNSTETILGSCSNGANGSIVINPSGAIAPYTYSINGGTFQTSNTFNNLNAGTYTITIKDAFCGTLTKTVTVGLKPSPSIFAGNDQTIVDGDEWMINGSGTATATSIVWSPNTTIVNGASTYTPTVKPRATTNYLLTVTDANACVSTDNVTITVIPYCLKVQNAFSPNADGINDRWQVTNGAPCYNKIIAAVYNRYGNLVYKNDNYQNNWDGTYEGKPLPDGTYYYVLTYNLINGKGQTLKGDVTILR